jgi:hypothetical protein
MRSILLLQQTILLHIIVLLVLHIAPHAAVEHRHSTACCALRHADKLWVT